VNDGSLVNCVPPECFSPLGQAIGSGGIAWSERQRGHTEAGPRVAAIISIVETCRRLSLPVRDYLGSVLPGLADFPINRVAELTPTAWAVRN
jgi:hypothetical protein